MVNLFMPRHQRVTFCVLIDWFEGFYGQLEPKQVVYWMRGVALFLEDGYVDVYFTGRDRMQ